MQSYLQKKIDSIPAVAGSLPKEKSGFFPTLRSRTGPQSQFRQFRVFCLCICIYALAALLFFGAPTMQTLGLGLIVPGGGFLAGWDVSEGLFAFPPFFFFISIFLFAGSLFAWFATGNVFLPPFVWAVSLIAALIWQSTLPVGSPNQGSLLVAIGVFGLFPTGLSSILLARFIAFKKGQARRNTLNNYLINAAPIASAAQADSCEKDELSLKDLQHMRLLLDRALQPVDEFQGFEWIDQFQTSAVRYQVNFISYALSLAQYNYLPAFDGYLSRAQTNLRTKQENPRIWSYWALENLWGNLRRVGDPIAKDNIMYSGFVAAQLALARRSTHPNAKEKFNGLSGDHSNRSSFSYTTDEIIDVLVKQYKNAEYGLLSCEPNWVYPLCNAITATAIRAYDTQFGTIHWDEIKDGFRDALETEFITPGGRFIPFRSNYTGFAAPQIGGAVMQAFPCFFLNAVLPDIAKRQWLSLRHDMRGKNWRRALWPIDVGNYGFSRASSYAATALSAREMGDDDLADHLLQYLDSECPIVTHDGVSHHSSSSLWANATAFMARTSKQNTLRHITTTRPKVDAVGPYLSKADYNDVLVAKAVQKDGALDLVVYPNGEPGFKSMQIGGLVPGASYRLKSDGLEAFSADNSSRRNINVPVRGRTELHISRVS